MNLIKGNFTKPPNSPDQTCGHVYELHGYCSKRSNDFTKESNLRIVNSTCAFGMGIDCPNIRQVIHLGAPCDIETYVQDIGRADRDGLPSLALLLTTPRRKDLLKKI